MSNKTGVNTESQTMNDIKYTMHRKISETQTDKLKFIQNIHRTEIQSKCAL